MYLRSQASTLNEKPQSAVGYQKEPSTITTLGLLLFLDEQNKLLCDDKYSGLSDEVLSSLPFNPRRLPADSTFSSSNHQIALA